MASATLSGTASESLSGTTSLRSVTSRNLGSSMTMVAGVRVGAITAERRAVKVVVDRVEEARASTGVAGMKAVEFMIEDGRMTVWKVQEGGKNG